MLNETFSVIFKHCDLGVAPRFAKNKESNWKWKVQPYEDNLRFMKSAGRIQESMPKATKLTILWLLFNGELKFDYQAQLTEFWPANFSAIGKHWILQLKKT